MSKEDYDKLTEIAKELDDASGKLLGIWRNEIKKRDDIKDTISDTDNKDFSEASDICCSLSGIATHLVKAIDEIVLLQDAYTAQTHCLKNNITPSDVNQPLEENNPILQALYDAVDNSDNDKLTKSAQKEFFKSAFEDALKEYTENTED